MIEISQKLGLVQVVEIEQKRCSQYCSIGMINLALRV